MVRSIPRAIALSLAIFLAEGVFLSQAQAARRYTVRPTVDNPTAGDFTDGEDADAREAAVKALGNLNGVVVAVEADTGRVLTMVNQKLALADGYIPCSTIKPFISLAALAEGVVEPEEKVAFPGPWYMTIVEGMAISNNVIFAELGDRVGFEKFSDYAHLFGLGEKAGWKIPGEQVGAFPEDVHEMGVGRMTSFGSGIKMTPLQLAAMTAAIANGGKLYYLQHPNTQADIERFQPKLKRQLPVSRFLDEVSDGMREAVRRGTGRNADVLGVTVSGKTGTCSEYEPREGTRLGWFTSFARGKDGRRIAVTVMLRGGGSISGGTAALVAGPA